MKFPRQQPVGCGLIEKILSNCMRILVSRNGLVSLEDADAGRDQMLLKNQVSPGPYVSSYPVKAISAEFRSFSWLLARNPCWQSVRIACSSRWFRMLLTRIRSCSLQNMEVGETGL